MMTMKNYVKEGQRLPLFGIGPYLISSIVILDIIGVILSGNVLSSGVCEGVWAWVFRIIGIVLIPLGIFIWYMGALGSKMDEHIENNKLQTGGIYAWVRNPMYTGVWFIATGVMLMWHNLWLPADLISPSNEPLATALKINTFIGCYTGLLCHVAYCIKPLLYQKLCKKLSDDESAEVVSSINSVIIVPMIIGGLTLWLGGTIIVAIAIITGALAVPKLCVLLNPVISLIVLMVLKKVESRSLDRLESGLCCSQSCSSSPGYMRYRRANDDDR